MSVHTELSTATAPVGGSSFWSASRLIAEREIQAQIRNKGFWSTIGVFVIGLFAAAILPGLFGGGATTVATVGPAAAQQVATTDLDAREVADVAQAEELVRTGEVDAAVVPDPSGESVTGVRVIALTSEPWQVVAVLSSAPPIDLLDPAEVSDQVRVFVVLAFALVFLVFAMFGIAIAQSVVVEKQTRIVEILVATVPVRALLTGKIAGHSLLVFAQVGLLALLTPLALRLGEQGTLLSLLGPALGWFVPFFIVGFVLLAAMWAVAGAVVSRQEDLGSSTSLVMTLVMLPYFGVVFLQDSPVGLTVLSYVPFSAAIAMPVRLFTGDAAPWEPFLSLGLVATTAVACVLIGARLYSGSLLQTGGRVKLTRAWSRDNL